MDVLTDIKEIGVSHKNPSSSGTLSKCQLASTAYKRVSKTLIIHFYNFKSISTKQTWVCTVIVYE